MAKQTNDTVTIRSVISIEANINIENIKNKKRLEGHKMSKDEVVAYMLLNFKDKAK